MTSNSSFHSTQDEFDVSTTCEDEGESRGSNEEVRLLRQALESVQLKLLETRKENRSLQSQLKPERSRERDEYERVREKGREEELMESLAELQAKLTDTQERYHQAVEAVEDLRVQVGREGQETTENQDAQRCARLEQEIRQLKDQLVQSGSEQEEVARRMRKQEDALAQEEQRRVLEEKQKVAEIEELYKEAQEEIKMLQVGGRNVTYTKLHFICTN